MLKGSGQNSKKNRRVFFIELFCAILLSIVCSLIGMSNLLWSSNDLILSQTDIGGHMTKVLYLAEQISKGHLPSWFPYWYNGATTTQYYVPLSYYIMIPIYWATHNTMLTYKLYCTTLMVIGSLGVWNFCYQKIGRVCGLVGIVAFSLQPILLESLYREGVVAQAPIFALMPWLLLLLLTCVQKPTKGLFVATTISVTFLIMCHAMHAYLVCLSIMLVLFLFIFLKKISVRNFIITSGTIVFSGLLTAFWSVVGATGLEIPGVPSTPEAVYITVANFQWFIPNGKNAFFYFSIAVTALSLIGVIGYVISAVTKKNDSNSKFFILAAYLISGITVALSFGTKMPFYRFIPLSSSLIAGRILTLTAVTGAIACSYSIYLLWNIPKAKFLFRPLTLIMVALFCYFMNPFTYTFPVKEKTFFETMEKVTENKGDAFSKGRFEWYAPLDSSELFASYLHNYNTSNGSNIEGTSQKQVVYNNYIALPVMEYDYILKEIAYWNIKYLTVDHKYTDLMEKLKTDMGFAEEEKWKDASLFISKQPSSYYLIDHRNALIVSNGLQGLCISFPNLVQGKSENLWDYTEAELKRYELIYIIEPNINSRTKKSKFEKTVTSLVNEGIKVIIEPSPSNIFDIFGVQTKDEIYEDSPIFTPTQLCPYGMGDLVIEENSHLPRVRGLYGLDEVYAEFAYDTSDIRTSVLGTKKVGTGQVVFVGAHLSQYLSGVYVRNNGMGALDNIAIDNSEKVKMLFGQLFQFYEVKEDYLPDVFDGVISHAWDYDGGSFTYDSDQAKEVTVSITYSPRWTVAVDGKHISVTEKENLIALMLPAGQHTVVLSYGITIYGKIGYAITIAGFVIFILFMALWKWIIKLINYISDSVTHYLQIDMMKEEINFNGMAESSTDTSILQEIPETQELPLSENALKEASESEIAVTDISRQQLTSESDSEAITKHEIINNGIKIEIMEIDGELVSKEVNLPVDEIRNETVDEVGDSLVYEVQSAAAYEDDETDYVAVEIEKDGVMTEVLVKAENAAENVLQNPDELERILKKAIYANQREKLKEYYDYLKTNISNRN